MGGKNALKALLEIDPMVTAIVSSGYATDAAMSCYEELGFRGVIAKPYKASALGRIVREMFEGSRATGERPSIAACLLKDGGASFQLAKPLHSPSLLAA